MKLKKVFIYGCTMDGHGNCDTYIYKYLEGWYSSMDGSQISTEAGIH